MQQATLAENIGPSPPREGWEITPQSAQAAERPAHPTLWTGGSDIVAVATRSPPKSGRTGDVCAVRTYASKRHEAESKPSRPQGAGDTATHHAPLQSTCRAGQGAPDKHVAQPYKLALRGSEATTHRLWGHGCFAHRRRPPSRRPTERRGHLGQASDPAPPPRSDARFVGAQRCRMNASWTDTRHRRQALRRAVCTLCWATDRCRPLGVGATHTHTHMARNGRRATMAKARLAIPEPRSQRDAPTSAAGRRSPSRLHEEAVCEP